MEYFESNNHEIVEICYARIGLMGNPSDGFQGKTLSFLLKNYYATVTIQEKAEEGIEIIDNHKFHNLEDLFELSPVIGYEGGLKLLQATCKSFVQCCHFAGLEIKNKNFRMFYTTTIPRMVGLSGSSAIIVAAFNALLKFHSLTIQDLNILEYQLPEIILNVEKVELGISAGLQDRVIQSYGGLVHMDFSLGKNIYTRLNPELLPQMYLLYNTKLAGNSGKVHSNAKARWEAGDLEIIDGMKLIGSLADEAVKCLETKDYIKLGELMNQNFSMRRKLYGDSVVGQTNIEVSDLAHSLGLSLKFTGSGGAFVCLRSNGSGWFSEDEENKLKRIFNQNNFKFERIKI